MLKALKINFCFTVYKLFFKKNNMVIKLKIQFRIKEKSI